MNIAIFISGRLTCYDTDLIPNLKSMSEDYNIHLFVSINGERDAYHQEAEERLSPWLKKIRYEKYKIPDTFIPNTNPETLVQIIDGKRVPYTVLSCFYNDLKCYEMIEAYCKETGIHMDTCVKFRADISFTNRDWSIFKRSAENPDILFSNIPPDQIHYGGDRSIPCYVSDAFICTSLEKLKIYCDTYNFILKTNNEMNGTYRLNYEVNVTENLFGKPIDDTKKPAKDHLLDLFANMRLKYEYFTLPYTLNKFRRSRETLQETLWWRQKVVP